MLYFVNLRMENTRDFAANYSFFKKSQLKLQLYHASIYGVFISDGKNTCTSALINMQLYI